LGALAGPGDEVFVLRPRWPGHVGAVESVGASVVEAPVDRNGLASVNALEAVRTARTRAVVFANPSNPSGVLRPAGLLADIAAWCVDRDVWLVSDEVYGGLVFHTDPSSATDIVTDPARLVVVDGVSKVHAMTGWRVGWLLGPAAVVAAARAQVSATITHIPSITQHAALAPLTASADAETVARYRASRDLLVGKLSQVSGVECPTPAGGMFAFPDISKLLGAEHPAAAELAAWLLDEAHVGVVLGEVLGDDRRLRISSAPGQMRLAAAADRLVPAFTNAGS
jgi:aspartate aminotransferase